MTTTKEELEKRIIVTCKIGASYPSAWNIGFQAGFCKGANSPEAKALWQHGMYTEEEVFELLKNSHFVDVNIIEWFELNKKKS